MAEESALSGEVVATRPRASNRHPLDFVEADGEPSTIVELRRPYRGVVRHDGRLFERAAVPQIGGDARGPKTVIANPRRDPRGHRPPPHHLVGVGLGQGRFREFARAATDRRKQWSRGIGREAAAFDVVVEVGFEIVVAWHPACFDQRCPDLPVEDQKTFMSAIRKHREPGGSVTPLE